MSITLASWIAGALAGYLGIGLLFAIPFVLFGAGRIDPLAKEATVGFRLLVLPGAAALWPLLLGRWVFSPDRPPRERNAHRTGAARLDPRPERPP